MLNLNGLKHSRSTDLQARRISNQDVVLLGIAEGMSSTEIRNAIKDWRTDLKEWGPGHFTWYFSSGESPRLEPVRPARFGHKVVEAWYRRTSKGRYELTKAGWRRIAKIHGVPVN